jgi:hypothetical protein
MTISDDYSQANDWVCHLTHLSTEQELQLNASIKQGQQQPTSNPFAKLEQFTREQEELKIHTAYCKSVAPAQHILTSHCYGIIRYISYPLIAYTIDRAAQRTAGTQATSSFKSLLGIAGILCTISEIPATWLRHRAHQYKTDPNEYRERIQILARYRSRQSLIDITMFMSAYCGRKIAKVSNGQTIVLPWLGIHVLHGLCHLR